MPGDVRDDRATVAVEDRPARRLDAHEPELVVLRRVQVLVAGEHLKRPEPQEEDREHDQRDPAEDADAERESRGAAGTARGHADRAGGTARRASGARGTRRQTRTSTSGGPLEPLGLADARRGRARTRGARAARFRRSVGTSEVSERVPRDDLLAQHVVEDEREDAREHRDHPDREERGEATAGAGRLDVAAGPEPGEREDERRDAERLERQQVDDETAGEAVHGAGDRSAQQSRARPRRRAGGRALRHR